MHVYVRLSFRYIFLVLSMLLFWAPSALAQSQVGYDLEQIKAALKELIERSLQENGIPSISIALVKGNAVVWKAAFGYANVRTKTPATTDTLYSTGSTFKSVTATAVMQLVDKGKIKLEQPINAYLGDARVQDRLQSEKAVTFEHILSHWSGLVGGEETQPLWGRQLPKTLPGLTSRLYSIRAPEVKYEYNNAAYGLAGYLVERVSGTEYEKYMVDNVLRPLGIETPHPVYPSPGMVERMALPYTVGVDNRVVPVAQVHFDVYPAGDIYLTAEDMARYLGAHLNGGIFNGNRILSEASVRSMHIPRFGGDYALGFGVKEDEKGRRIISHGGAIPGQSSNLLGDLDSRVGVYLMSNVGSPSSMSELSEDDRKALGANFGKIRGALDLISNTALSLLRGEQYVPPVAKKKQ